MDVAYVLRLKMGYGISCMVYGDWKKLGHGQVGIKQRHVYGGYGLCFGGVNGSGGIY